MSESTSRCLTECDGDRMGVAYEAAIANEDVSALAAMVAYYRSKAAFAEGRCAGMLETVAYLRDRVVTLEQREAICNPT